MPHDIILDTALNQIRNALENSSLQLLTFGTGIMVVMGFVQFCLATVYAFGSIGAHPVRYFLDIFRRILPIYVIFAFMPRLQGLGGGFFDEFSAFAGTLAGGAPLTPSAIFDLYLHMIGTIAKSRSVGMWIIGALNLEDLFFGLFALIVVVIGGMIAWQWLFVAIQAIAYAICAPIVACYAPLDEAWDSAMSWVRAVAETGVKVITMAVLLGAVFLMAQQWQQVLETAPINPQRMYYETITIVEAALSYYLVATIPNQVASLVIFSGGGRGGSNDEAYHSATGTVRKLVGKLGV